MILGAGAPSSVGRLLPDGCACQRSEIITFRFRCTGERFAGPPKLPTWCGYPGAAKSPQLGCRSRAREKAATRSNTSNTNVTPSRSFVSTLLSTFSTPLCLPSSVFVLQLDSLLSSRTFLWPWLPSLDFSLVASYLPPFARLSIRTEKTPEAATIVPSAPTYAHSLSPSILESHDLPPSHPFLSAPWVFPVCPSLSLGKAAALPACIYGLLVMATATRRATLR